ncbi:DEAD/DEAH box helicase [bacterium]|nr:DEAD/DEAH box helicase [bacterium]
MHPIDELGCFPAFDDGGAGNRSPLYKVIFLHLALVERNLFVWGETEAGEHAHWPYALDQQRLLEVLARISVRSAQLHTLNAKFPVHRGKAIPSSTIFGEFVKDGATLSEWTIPAAKIPRGIATEFLQIDESKIDDGLFYGDDVLYWSQALRFVKRLMFHQKFLPWLFENGEAGWIPVLTGEDLVHFQELARSMPPFIRAFGDGISSEHLLHEFVASFLNQNIREGTESSQSRSTPPDRWLAALQQPDGRMEGKSEEILALRNAVRSWAEPLLLLANFKYRVAFRLEEPTAKKDYWYVRYFLQRHDDPSLMIPASHLWKQKKSSRQVLKEDFERSKQILLTELAQAGRIDPYIQMSLHREAPEGYRTDSKGAWEFLDTKAWILQDVGYGVLLPSWWARKKGIFTHRLGLKAKAKSSTPKAFAGLGSEVLVEFDWKFAIGDQEITYKELMALARLKQPLVKFRGRWIAIRPEEIASAMEFWKSREKESGSLFDLLKLGMGTEQIGELPVQGVEAEGWVADFLLNFREHSKYVLIPVPDSFQGELRPYQQRGLSWLYFMKTFGIGACLADDMGLGKTVQTIALLLKDAGETPATLPVLIVCPTSVVGNWQRELSRFAPSLNVEVHHGLTRKKGDEFKKMVKRTNVVISSYALLLRDFETMRDIQWRAVILDEAQNIKNAETKQARAARSLQADYRAALTGTPMENNVGEVWSLMEFLNRGLLGSKTEFTKKYFVPIHKYGSTETMEELKRITSPFVLRRLKSDPEVISDLPKKLEMKVFCNLTKEQASLYAAVVRELESEIDKLEGIERKGKVLAAITRLKQICNHPAHFLRDGSPLQGRSGKLARLTEMLEEVLELNERSLLFTQFSEMGELLHAHLQNYFGKEAAFLHGGVVRKKREEMVERFHLEEGGPPFFVLSLKAGGTGLNLTGANHVFHFDRWWNPAVEDQATDRAYRIGQKKNVQVHKFVCVGTLEERIDQILETKKQLADNVIGTGEAWLTELSTSEIKSLITLGKDAVAV